MPVNANDREDIRRKHFQGEVIPGSVSGVVRCFYDGEPWPCSTVRLLEVATVAADFIGTWDETMASLVSDYDFTMHCEEADKAVALWRAVGESIGADAILDRHAAHDTEEERHYERGVRVRARRQP